MRKPPIKIIIEEWDGDGAIRIPDEALQELELDVGDAVYLIRRICRQHTLPCPIKKASNRGSR
ncbi:antitoxin component of MazEF toxin-antitoxin module [Pseudomonas sp. PvR086]